MVLWTIRLSRGAIAVLFFTCLALPCAAQERLKAMPGYERYQKMSREIGGAYRPGTVQVTWKDGGSAFEYMKDGKRVRFDIATLQVQDAPKNTGGDAAPSGRGGFGRRGGVGPARGRQFTSATSPDGKLKAVYKNRNLFLTDAKGGNERPITTDGSEKGRIKYGTASWVYGEELFQGTAIWWSPDSKKVAFYRFDESKVPDYFLQVKQTDIQSKMDIEAYPKAGAPNPVVDLFIYHVDTDKKVPVDVRDGKPFENHVVGHYVYGVEWSADAKELIFHRTDRLQKILELAAADPETGKCRVILHEEWLPSWVENSPPMQYLKDKRRFLWTSERTGYKNLYLYNLGGRLEATLTKHNFDVGSIVKVDEDAGYVYYTAHDGDNPLKLQLHRVKLDGTDERRLTNPAFHHTVSAAAIAPDNKHFIDTAQTHDTPPLTWLVDDGGRILAEVGHSDLTKFESLGLKRVELLTFKAADGKTDLYGMLHRPSNFDPKKKYPLLVSVYAGPATNAARETFTTPSPLTEYGFLVAQLDARSAAGRGKQFLDAIYTKLGITEIDDLAAGVKSLWDRPYVDRRHVGIFGTSYGGYASIMCLLRHPDVFQAACASSPVTSWYHYDTIYTERYMGLPQENKAAYDAGSAMTYADKLKGRLLIYYGTADDNVHPNNAMQLIRALQRAQKSFEVQVGPDLGHSGVSQTRMMEFFIENLVLWPRLLEKPTAE